MLQTQKQMISVQTFMYNAITESDVMCSLLPASKQNVSGIKISRSPKQKVQPPELHVNRSN